MRIFITGASGHIGSAVVADLLEAGHEVIGLARSDSSAATITASGAEVQRGDLTDTGVLSAAAAASDGVIHLAFGDIGADMAGAIGADLAAIEAIGTALAGTGKPFLSTNATLPLSFLGGITDRPATEHDVLPGGPRVDAENAVIALAGRDVRSSVVRIPPLVHSRRDQAGLFPQLVGVARARGVAGYLGEGANRWPAVHTLDVARLYRLAIENAPSGTRLHAVAESGPTFRELAEVIGAKLGLPAAPVEPDHFGYLAMFVALDNPISSDLTRELLAWDPVHPALREDIDQGFYFS